MLRHLSIGILFCTALLVLAQPALSVPVAEETVSIDIDPSNWPTDGETRLYGYDQGWQYVNDEGSWTPVTQPEDLNDNHQTLVANPLADMTHAEGYDYFLQLWYNPAVHEIIPGEAELRKLYQQKLPPEQTGTTKNTGDTDKPEETGPEQNTGRCGINANYVKFCYNERAMHSADPLHDEKAIKKFVSRAINNERVDQGFIIITYAPEDKDIEREYQKVRVSRERELRRSTEAAVANAIRGQALRVVSESYEEAGPSPHPRSAYLIPDNALRNGIPAQVLDHASHQTFVSRVADNRLSVQDAWEEQWKNTVGNFTDEELTDLANDIKKETGITIYLVANDQEWQIGSQENLNKQIRNQIGKAGQSNAPTTTADDHPRACASYILLDPTGIEVYQSKYCGITIDRTDIHAEDSVEQATQILRSAARHTPTMTTEDLLLTAYAIAEEARAGGEAERLVNVADEDAFKNQMKDAQRKASQEIVRARIDLTLNDPESALETAKKHTPDAFREMRILGAETAIEAARQTRRCEELGNLMHRFQEHLDTRSGAYRRAQNALSDCQYRRARTQCQPVEANNRASEYPQLEITFLNDGLDKNTFETHSTAVANRILDTYLGTYGDDITFKHTPSTAPLTQGTSRFDAPRIDTKATQQAARACYGDILVVLSDENYYPVTAGGNSYVSAPGCSQSTRCMALYATRSLSYGVLGLERAHDTVTASFPRDPSDPSIPLSFNTEQRAAIDAFFGGGQ